MEHRRRPSSPGTKVSEDLGNPWKEGRKYLGKKELGYWVDRGTLYVSSLDVVTMRRLVYKTSCICVLLQYRITKKKESLI